MISFFHQCWILLVVFQYSCIYGKRDPLKRHVIDDSVKPAIFGSYNYDPVKRVFDPLPSPEEKPEDNEIQPAGEVMETETKPELESTVLDVGRNQKHRGRSLSIMKITRKAPTKKPGSKNRGTTNHKDKT